MNDRAAVFSKGMRQRLAIARALIHSPKVLLLDEPFSSLDQKGIDILSQIVTEERAKGCAILVITHDVSRISALADRADVLAGGHISASYRRDEIERGELERCYRKASEVGVT
jgi:ABC-type multidrug transport system ATPase subunit